MRTRTAQDIRRDLLDAQRRLRDLQVNGDATMSDYDLMMGYNANTVIPLLEAYIASYERELKESTRHGEQLAFGF